MAGRAVARRAEREARDLADAPRFRVVWPWRRAGDEPGGQQTLRAFVQINVLPRPR
jgi:hypothetical protein